MESINWNKQVMEIPNGETIGYSILGEGPEDFVLIHGMWGNLQVFAPIISLLVKKFRVILVDMRGHGLSSYNKPVESNDDVVMDTHHVLEKLNVNEFYMGGQSSGCLMAWRYASLFPERVKKLVLISPASLSGQPIFRKNKEDPTNKRFVTEKSDYAASKKNTGLYDCQKNRDLEGICYGFMISCFNGPKKPAKEALEHLAASNFEVKNFEDFRWICNLYNYTDKKSLCGEGDNSSSKIKCPVLILMGDLDILIPKETIAEYEYYVKEKLTVKFYPEVGHLFLEIYPEQVVADIEKFIESNEVTK